MTRKILKNSMGYDTISRVKIGPYHKNMLFIGDYHVFKSSAQGQKFIYPTISEGFSSLFV